MKIFLRDNCRSKKEKCYLECVRTFHKKDEWIMAKTYNDKLHVEKVLGINIL